MRRLIFAGLAVALAALALPGEALAQATASAITSRGTPIIIGQSYPLASSVLSDERTIAVYLPQHYSDPARRFPVIYLLDGGADEDFPHITGLVGISAAYGTTAEAIVIGIQGKDRRHDLTSPSRDPEDLKVAPTSGGSTAYRRFLVEELKPWVEARYRTDGRSVLMGESLAGLFVAETALRSPTAFDDYIAISPSLWWNREALSREAAQDLGAADFSGRRLWLAVGDEVVLYPSMKDGIERLVSALQAAGPQAPVWTYNPMPTESHATIYHPAALAALRALYRLEPAAQ